MFVQLFIHGITNEQADKSGWRANERGSERRVVRRRKKLKWQEGKSDDTLNDFRTLWKISGEVTSSKGSS